MVAGCFVLVLGVFAVAAAWRLSRDARRVRHYVAVPGRVVTRAVRAATATSAGVSDGPRYEPHVEYTYDVAGQTYVGDRISLVHTTYTEAAAERAVAALGDEVTVWTDPDRPAESVLRRGGLGMALGVGGGGGLAILAGVALIVGGAA